MVFLYTFLQIFDLELIAMLKRLKTFLQKQSVQKLVRISAWLIGGLFAVLLVLGILAFAYRDSILRMGVKKVIAKAKEGYQIDLQIKNAHFSGFKTVAFDEITAVPEHRDSLVALHQLRLSVQLFPLLFGKIKLDELTLDRGFVHLVKLDSLRNYDFLFKKKKDDKVSQGLQLGSLANRLLNSVFYKIPENLSVNKLELAWIEDGSKVVFEVKDTQIISGEVNATIDVNQKESIWHLKGSVDPGDRQLDLTLFADGKKLALPYLEKRFGLKLDVDTLHTQMDDVSYFAGKLSISGSWKVKNLRINHPKIAANDVVVDNGELLADMAIGENYVELAESSVIHVGKIELNPHLRFTLKPNKIYELNLHSNELNAQDVFNSFPKGLFESLEGIRVQGNLQYDLHFLLDESQPDAVEFHSQLNKSNFKILGYGKTNLSKINSDFMYTPYEYGKPMRNILVGVSNPYFTPLDQISPYLKNALLTAEDPSFFGHRGFVEEAVRKSIATNFKRKAFKRGASTISMQLVKNVYLNRQKTLARKLEEMLMVWLIENNRLSSKSRMLEVYLNIIEWGNNVYGIGEASRYYFEKTPAELNLGESIYLASIVPRPKSSLYFFEYGGNLRSSMVGYFNTIGGLMAKRGLTPPDSSSYGFYSVRLKESLRSLLARPDSLSSDSLFNAEEGMWFEPDLPRTKADSLLIKK